MYSRIVDKIVWLFERILILLMAAVIVIITMQVFFRYVLRDPLHWSEQTARMLFVWSAFLGVPVIFHGKVSMSFDMLIDKIPGKGRVVIEIVIQALVAALGVFFLVCSIQLISRSIGIDTQGVRVPVNLLYASMPISMFSLILVEIDKIIVDIKKIKGGEQG